MSGHLYQIAETRLKHEKGLFVVKKMVKSNKLSRQNIK